MFQPVLLPSFGALLLLGAAVLPSGATAASLSVQVSDEGGRALSNAVVFAEPVAGGSSTSGRTVEIEQRHRKFEPLVTVVQTGTAISFPNHDTVRHHVYSFSPAKQFELKLYSGVPASPVTFDKPGSVVLGCNIHDRMVAYIYVVPTPYFAKTDGAGQVRLTGLPAGKYALKAWHYNLAGATPEQPLNLGGDAQASLRLKLKAAGSAPATAY